ncbi:hypothetical protein BC939DRAFT_533416 [Gamsiella multidivaricata]|uniref:uncharacterized protein n=1 Tax=Gamsiella multidivaricata TaxID=101098 RepID=UPI00221FC090|nr:uncharacterized protein BC939DRAFT_533416 [Gamsiella multidivaricata]KAG0362731.1 hypothetical protein BGZ54_008499 [Gamsiella multidivaricata]KAI7816584.1 hypothetical protein BC939DRAFT_533416 [Gamsiella multidivaricata]
MSFVSVEENSSPPTVLIVGAGIGGLTLAVLLQRAGIHYEVLERAAEIRPLGSALALGANVLHVFEQLGLADAILKKSKPVHTRRSYTEKRELKYSMDYSRAAILSGYPAVIIDRPTLYSILLEQIPSAKVHMRKKVLYIYQDSDGYEHNDIDTHPFTKESLQGHGVMVQCSDNSRYYGDILVGADGAYSGVRQSLYKHLGKIDKLPESDKDELPFNSMCLVGQTRPLDVTKFPYLQGEASSFQSIVGENKPYTWSAFSTRANTICWIVTHHMDKEARRSCNRFQNSEWGPEKAESMCAVVKDFPIACGGDAGYLVANEKAGLTIGDLINETPRDCISKVTREEKFFETWCYKRVVLIGDACHKLYPSAGLGAVSAIQDATILANVLHDLLYPITYPASPPLTSATLTAAQRSSDAISMAFQLYRDERFPLAKSAFETSHRMGALIGKSWINDVIRALTPYTPTWLWEKQMMKMFGYRPQASFLPKVQDNGEIPPLSQPSLERAEENKRRVKARMEREAAISA